MLYIFLTVVLLDQHGSASIHREHERTACHVVERIVAPAVACRRIGYPLTVGRVDNPDGRVEVSLSIDHGASLHFPFDRILLCVVQRLAAYVAALKQLIVVEGTAKIEVTNVAALKLKRLVDVDQSAKHLQLHAGLAREVVGVRQSATEHTTQSGIERVELLLEEAEIDVETELGIEVSVKLAFAIPSFLSGHVTSICTL